MRTKGTILITGAARRIGKTLAQQLSREGYGIALHYHSSRAQAEAVARSIRRAKGRVQLFACDLSNETAVLGLIARVKKDCPDLIALINNASIFAPSKIADPSMHSFHENMAVNFVAPYILTKQFAKHCGRGAVINILDTKITTAASPHADYLLSKKALAALGGLCARELAPRIRVNAIAPGFILAPVKKTKTTARIRINDIPLKRKGHPKNIAQAALFLLENDFVTGETIFVDGGEHLI
jgi:NAD(P)-dependent dehydrogenase (short-subunit alcohol dehydrogenase family)